MKLRFIVTSALIIAATATAACGNASAEVPSAAPVHAASCANVQTLTFTSSQAAAAKSYWTASRINATKSFSQSALKGLTAPTGRALTAAPSSSEMQCLPDLAGTGTSALLAAPGVGPAGTGATPKATAATTSSDGYPTVGKLTYKADGVVNLNCTATVINGTSAPNNEELILTAAHCIEGTTGGVPYTSTDLAFSPMWNNNNAPYGTWTSEKVFLNGGWMDCTVPVIHCSTNPLDDYAIIVLNTQNGEGVGTLTGAAGWNSDVAATVDNATLAGIPGSSSDTLTAVADATTVTESGQSYRTAATPGFTDGTSGGPWFENLDASTGIGTLFGDTGGYEQGGPSSGTPSYSDVWDSAFATVVADAVAYED